MWKSYNRFYKQILKSEMALFVKSKNVHKTFKLNIVSVTSNASHHTTLKKALLHLSYLNLVLGNKAKIVKLGDSNFDINKRSGSALGSTILLRKDLCFQFIFFCLCNVWSLSDTARPIRKVQSNTIMFSLKTTRFFNRVLPSIKFYREINKIRVLISFNSFCENNVFLLRFMKFPISSS